ncbi:tRNA (adenosine(37)-N6)-threonylcarbamoyltransferase complex ATPase subunit type 1 TsaE [Arthrobacter sp.]|uniref:tRNA (adenosine(37)-N6)-threonylcarbamoyltransferase complex ATPase subunit type 1 TsaE n=1 Tax=Arthrobacter sp. TaxID=1667 RepID=UPI0028114BC8|nr:tRNA (adenosine(37)-N6)-threonylcarbamoyltransferase complex ATPase subunit type 1 TsaE [Arthrobacter sp.]
MPASAPSDSAQWEQTFHVETAEQTHELAAAIGSVLEAGDLLVLTGELGAGKTTFTQGLGEGLGVRAGIISPTFVLVRIHPNLSEGPRPGGPDLVHVDAYRLESASEIDDIDLENTMDSSVTVVEWGRERVEHLSDSRLEVELYRRLGSAGLPSVSYSPESPEHASPEQAAVLDFAPEDDDEPRTIVIRGFGPRWARQPSWPGIPEGIS